MIEEIKAAGFGTVELNFALSQGAVDEILAMKERGEIAVSSLHNMCPLPPEISPEEASPDHYSLASSDEEERRRAVRIAENTILYAKRFGARAIVLHAGRVPTRDLMRDLAATMDDPKRFSEFRERMIHKRAEDGRGCLDNVMRSLDDLVPFAMDLGIAIGVENRYYYREIPVLKEFEALFGRFKKGELFYWHDSGHAEVFERLGLASHRELLRRFSERLIGVHLHDIIGPVTDHRPPGTGTFDFSIIKQYLKPDTIIVMEVHEPATADEMRRGADHLMKVLL
jgi:sugar phosphate isomerase/epimerase